MLFPKCLPLFALMVLVLVTAGGCVPVATSSSSQPATGDPVAPLSRPRPQPPQHPGGGRPAPHRGVERDRRRRRGLAHPGRRLRQRRVARPLRAARADHAAVRGQDLRDHPAGDGRRPRLPARLPRPAVPHRHPDQRGAAAGRRVHGHRQRRDDHLHRPGDLAGQPAASRGSRDAASRATAGDGDRRAGRRDPRRRPGRPLPAASRTTRAPIRTGPRPPSTSPTIRPCGNTWRTTARAGRAS